MANKYQFFLLLFFFAVFVRADPPYNNCIASQNPTTGFQQNLQLLLPSLISDTNYTEYSYENNEDRVHGNFLCYLTIQNGCQNCAIKASQDIRRLCPSSTDAVVWEENCQLRYSTNKSASLDYHTNQTYFNMKNYSNPEIFRTVVRNLVNNLSSLAAKSSSYMAAGQQSIQKNDTVYGLVQCTGDLSPNHCYDCLQNSLDDIQNCCYFYRGARVLRKSCFLRYELYNLIPTPTELYNLIPTPTTHPPIISHGKEFSLVLIIVIIGATVAVISLFFCWFYFCVWGIQNSCSSIVKNPI